MSSGSSPSQTTTHELSPEQRQFMNLAMPGVVQYASQTPQRYQGSTVAGFTPYQVAGQEGAVQSAGTQTALGQSGANAATNWLGPNALDISNNPTIQGAMETATRPIYEQLTRYGLPAIRSSAEQTGNFGSSRQGIAEGLAIEGASKAAGDVTSRIASDAYKTNVDAQLKALGLLPQTQGAQTTGNYTLSNVGDVRQAMEQAKINEQLGNFNWDQMAPYLQSRDIMSLIAGMPGGQTTTTATAPQTNRLTSSLGGAASGATLGSFAGPAGTVAGAGIGALLPFLMT